ncbi:MAG: hypothetical protein ACXACU_18005 [Candidatus Hodarchaeales archaeon]
MNFFTPTVIIATGHFLYNLFIYPLVIIQWLSYENKIDLSMIDIYTIMIPNITCLLSVLFVYYIIMPRLNVLDAEYQPGRQNSIYIFLVVFFIFVTFRIIVTLFFNTLGVPTGSSSPWYLGIKSYSLLTEPIFLIFFLSYQLLLNPLFTQLLFRRTVIPLMEDRGLSPFLAVILSSIGFTLLDLPFYIDLVLSGNSIFIAVYWTFSTYLYGLGTGIIYVLTRNIKFSFLYASAYQLYKMILVFDKYFKKELIYSFKFLTEFYIILVGIIVLFYLLWSLVSRTYVQTTVSILKRSSVPNISRGVLGFLILSILFAVLHHIISEIIDLTTFNSELMIPNYPDIFILYTVFYLIIFSVPFWITTKSEYTQY